MLSGAEFNQLLMPAKFGAVPCAAASADGADWPCARSPLWVMTNSPDDFYSLYLSSTNAEWWGWSEAKKNSAKGVNVPTPAEKRVFDTIEWVVKQHKIDRNRIYLCGVSMGGCGSSSRAGSAGRR